MKKIFLLSGIVLLFATATQAQIRVGIQAGANISNQSRNDFKSSKLLSTEAFKGFHAGVVADIPLTSNLYLQPQLQYTQKGAKYTAAFGTDAKLTMHYVEVPVNLLYKINVPFGKVYGGAGPVISYGFAGKIANNGQTNKLYSADKNWNRLDVSANAVAGVEFNNGFFANVNYQRGFRDINKSDAVTVKNRSAGLTVGYLLNLNK